MKGKLRSALESAASGLFVKVTSGGCGEGINAREPGNVLKTFPGAFFEKSDFYIVMPYLKSGNMELDDFQFMLFMKT